MNCAQVKFLGIPFRSQRTLGAHPSPLGIGVLRSSWSVAPPSSQTSPNVDGCVVQGPIGMPFNQFRIFQNVAAKSLDVATQKAHTKNV